MAILSTTSLESNKRVKISLKKKRQAVRYCKESIATKPSRGLHKVNIDTT